MRHLVAAVCRTAPRAHPHRRRPFRDGARPPARFRTLGRAQAGTPLTLPHQPRRRRRRRRRARFRLRRAARLDPRRRLPAHPPRLPNPASRSGTRKWKTPRCSMACANSRSTSAANSASPSPTASATAGRKMSWRAPLSGRVLKGCGQWRRWKIRNSKYELIERAGTRVSAKKISCKLLIMHYQYFNAFQGITLS